MKNRGKKAGAQAKVLQAKGKTLVADLQAVLAKHGHKGAMIKSLTISTRPNKSATSAAGMCLKWRCWTEPDGSTRCGWVLVPC